MRQNVVEIRRKGFVSHRGDHVSTHLISGGDTVTPQNILAQFENLGDSCEFGLVQRHYGIEPISLLRWAGVPAAGLASALTQNFAGLFRFENLALRPGGMVLDTSYKFLFFSPLEWDTAIDTHGDLTRTSAKTQAIFRKESARIAFLVNKFRDNLADRSHIYVFKSSHGLTDLDMLRIKAALDLHGPQRLLCVVPAKPGLAHRQVITVASGLKLAALAKLAPFEDQENADYDGWLAICETAVSGEWEQSANAAPATRHAEPGLPELATFSNADVLLDDPHIAASVYRALYRTLLLREADGTGLASNVEDAVSHRRTLEYAVNRVLISQEYEEKFRMGVLARAGAAPGR